MIDMIQGARPLSPREERDRDSKRKLMAAIFLLVLLILLAAVSYRLARRWNPALSATDLCPIRQAPRAETVILLDATDPWNTIQRVVIADEFRSLQVSIPRHARVTLYTLDSDFAGIPTPALRLCNPGKAEDFEGFPLIGQGGIRVVANPDSVERRWTEGFVARLDSIFAEQAASTGSHRTPLVEMLRGAAIDVFGSSDAREPIRRTIYMFSDGFQNSPLYSHYEDPVWTASDGRVLADLSVAGTAALRGVEVHLFLLDRDLGNAAPGQNLAGLVEFWDAFLAKQGATLMTVRRIEG